MRQSFVQRSRKPLLYLCGSLLQTSAGVKDLGIRIHSDFTWKIHLERMKQANRVFSSLRRNVASKVNMRIKLGIYKAMILTVLMYGSSYCNLNRGDMRNLERFQRKFVSWITNSKTMSYIEQLRLSNLLPMPMYYQLNDLLLSSLQQIQPTNTRQPALPGNRSMRRDDYFDLTKKRLEKSRGEFFFRTQRIANRFHHSIDFGNQRGLKHIILKQMWNDMMMRYKPENVCTIHGLIFYNCFDREKSLP